MEHSRNEKGVTSIEAVYVVVIAIFIIFFTVNVAAIYHNRMLVTACANEAASGVAEIYGSMGKEPFYAYTAPEYFKGRDVYRYLDKKELITSAEERAKWYSSFLIYDDEFAWEKSLDFSDVVVECEKNEIGLQTITVSIKREYPVFVMAPANFFGLDLTYEVSATGTAVCYDIIHQMNTMAFYKEVQNYIDLKIWPGVNNLAKAIDKIIDAIEAKQ